jgi:two-component system nitrate/nitrite response regulator NarL
MKTDSAVPSADPSEGASARPAIRIVIAGEYPIFRHGLRRLIDLEPGLAIVGEDADGSRLDALVRDLDPDVVLLGSTTSTRPMVETVQAAAAGGARPRIILLSDRIDTPEVTQGLAGGARGVVLKDSAPDVLFASIRHVMAGGIWLGQARADGTDSGLKKLTAARRQSCAFGLTPREVDIIRAVVAGCSNREIAARASISENTVKSHLTHIFNKSGASSRVELALFAAHHRLLHGI